jgi:hypothetical protein
MSKESPRLEQRDMTAVRRNGSVLDRAIPLGFPGSNSHVDVGVTAVEWYRRKHGRFGPGPGKFWPLHQLSGYGNGRL